MGTYQKSLRDVISLLDPDAKIGKSTRTAKAPAGKRARKVKQYKNPHTGEVIETKGGNHKTLKEWKAKWGPEAVELGHPARLNQSVPRRTPAQCWRFSFPPDRTDSSACVLKSPANSVDAVPRRNRARPQVPPAMCRPALADKPPAPPRRPAKYSVHRILHGTNDCGRSFPIVGARPHLKFPGNFAHDSGRTTPANGHRRRAIVLWPIAPVRQRRSCSQKASIPIANKSVIQLLLGSSLAEKLSSPYSAVSLSAQTV